MLRKRDGRRLVPAFIMGFQGLAILGTWLGFIRGGVFKEGVKTVENNMFLSIHVVAEGVMGVLLVLGSAGIVLGRSWGNVVGFLGLGAVIYSTINSMADTLRSKPKLTPVLLGNLLLAVATARMLSRWRETGKS